MTLLAHSHCTIPRVTPACYGGVTRRTCAAAIRRASSGSKPACFIPGGTSGAIAVKHPRAIRPALNGRGTGMTQMTRIAPDKILQLGSAFWGSKTLLSAIELGLFTRLAQQ